MTDDEQTRERVFTTALFQLVKQANADNLTGDYVVEELLSAAAWIIASCDDAEPRARLMMWAIDTFGREINEYLAKYGRAQRVDMTQRPGHTIPKH